MPPELPVAHVVHALPGRLRLRVPERKGDATWFEQTALALAPLRGIERVRLSPVTGSLVILHAGDRQNLLDQLAARNLFMLKPDGPSRQEHADPVAETAQPTVNLQQLAGLALLAAALVQLSRGQILPPAVSLLVYAAEALRRTEPTYPRSADAMDVSSHTADDAG